MRLAFTKMHGAANDFVVIDGRSGWPGGDVSALVERLCDRRRGVGADGVLVLGADSEHDFRMHYWNRDGGRAEFCGNGARCIARFALERGLGRAGEVTFATDAGVKRARLTGPALVALAFGPVEPGRACELTLAGRSFTGRRVDAGVPHFVVPVDAGTLVSVPLLEWARPLRSHAAFGPGGTNVDFVERQGAGRVAMRTYERGVEGETLACGSGAIATAVWAVAAGERGPITVLTAGGDALEVALEPSGTGFEATLTGPAELAFEGAWSGD